MALSILQEQAPCPPPGSDSFSSLGLLAGVYLTTPFFAGLMGYGDCRVPRIHPKGWHISLHRLGYEFIYEKRPRFGDESVDRGWFYDMNAFGGENNG